MIFRRFISSALILLFALISMAHADTVYLKNGRSIKGIIKSESNEAVELEVSGGVVKFYKSEIKSIEDSEGRDEHQLRQEWDEQRVELQKKIQEYEDKKASQTEDAQFVRGGNSIVVEVNLNRKLKARLLLDTGAGIILLRRDIASKLGVNLKKVKPDMRVKVADGRVLNAKHIVLKSVATQGVEVKKVDAAVLLEESGSLDGVDGLLGMSFLKKFNFKIDQENKKLILEEY